MSSHGTGPLPTWSLINTGLEGSIGKLDTDENIKEATNKLMSKVKSTDIVCYTDGSAEGGTKNGGAGAVVQIPGEIEKTVKKGLWNGVLIFQG